MNLRLSHTDIPNVQIGKNKYVIDVHEAVMCEIPLEQQIQRQLLLDPEMEKYMVDWGDLPRAAEGVLAGIQDGKIAKTHPILRHPRQVGGPIRLGIATYADDVEVVNPIGAKRVKHKVTLHYASILNAPPHVRSHLDNIFLIAVALSKDQASVGARAILQGQQGDKPAQSGFTFCDTMKKFARPQGISFSISRKDAPGYFIQSFQAYLLLVSADTLAAAELIGFKRGFSPKVHSPCWQCNIKGSMQFVLTQASGLP